MTKPLSVGIITMHRVTNFGSALQVYGLTYALRTLGYDVKIIDYRFPNSFQKNNGDKSHITKVFKRGKILKTIVEKFRSRVFSVWKQQKLLFQNFYREYFPLTRPYLDREDIITDPPKFDIVVTGSDQVWNTKHTLGDPTFLCDFAGKLPRFSFGSSFSSTEIDPIYREVFINYLKQYSTISVRERNGIKLVKELTGLEAEIVCDPSLLPDKEHYRTLSIDSKIKIDKPYILAYILDYNFNPYPVIEEVLTHLSREKGLDIIFLECGSIHGNNRKGNKMVFDAGPLEFLWLIDNADFVVTSSFHGAVFSILFEKDFYTVYDQKSKDDRLVSLCQTLKLESRLLTRDQDLKSLSNYPIDWEKTRVELSAFRSNSYNFLSTSLEKCLRNE